MILKLINRETLGSTTRQGSPIVRLSSKSGTVSFQKFAAQKMNLAESDFVEFGYDETDGTYYVFKSDEKTGFNIRNKNGQGYVFQSTTAVRKIFDLLNIELNSYRFILGEKTVIENVEYFPMFCPSPKE